MDSTEEESGNKVHIECTFMILMQKFNFLRRISDTIFMR